MRKRHFKSKTAALTAAMIGFAAFAIGCSGALQNAATESTPPHWVESSTEAPTKEASEGNYWTEILPDYYVPAYETPRLDELYDSDLFSTLIPKTLLPEMALESSYMTVYDPLTNPNDTRYLQLIFKTADGKNTLNISVDNSSGDETVADPADSTTYSVAYRYALLKSGASDNELNRFGCFLPDDVNREVFNQLVFVSDDGRCRAGISLLCGNRIVSYSYNGSKQISPDDFYGMVMSADIMQRN